MPVSLDRAYSRAPDEYAEYLRASRDAADSIHMARPTRSLGLSAGGDRPGLLAATLVCFIVFGLSILAAVVVHRIVDRQIEARIILNSDVLVEGIEEGIRDVDQHLSSVTGLFEASDDVTADEYRRFVNEIGLAPGMRGVGYMPIVSAQDLEVFQARMAETFTGYQVFEIDTDGNRVPVRPRGVYFPVQFFEPRNAVGSPLGLDGGSPPGRIRHLMESVATGQAIATPLLPLATTGEEGLVVYNPTVGPSGTVVGVVVAPLVLEDLMSEWVPAGLANILTWTVRDVTESALRREGLNAGDTHTTILPPILEGVVHSETIDVAGRVWQIDTAAIPDSPLLADSGRERWVLAIGLVMGLLAGAAVYSFLHKEEALREVEFLSDVIAAKNHFIAALSHKIGTPLTSVLGFSEILRDERGQMSPQEVRELIDALADEASDLATIHEDLVVLGRAEYGTLDLEAVQVDLGSEIAAVLEVFDLTETVPVKMPDGGVRALADPSNVRRILRHLIENAVVHGGDTVWVNVDSVDDTVVVDIIDDGDGVPSDHSWDVFEPYLRDHDAISGNPESIALGLSVSRTLAQRMEGDLTYHRVEGKTVFGLRLPIDGSVVEPVRIDDPGSEPTRSVDRLKASSRHL